MRYVLLGGRGTLGSGFREALRRRRAEVARLSPDWRDPAAVVGELRTRIPPLLAGAGPVTIVWAAGVGSIGAAPDLLRTESAGVRAVCDAVTSAPESDRNSLSVLFASSAGALFGGAGSALVHEHSVPRPVTAYGREKLAQEQVLRELAVASGARVVVSRISNLYGLAQGRLPARGLVAAAVRATRLRQPMVVFVSQDTRRDYIYNVDAAAVSLGLLETAPAGWSQSLVRDGATRTVSSILSLVGEVSGRRVPANYAERPETRLQPPVLRFAPRVQGPQEVRRTPMECAVHLMVNAPMVP